MNTGTARGGSVPADDRALLYGDGLFETIRFDRGRAALWALHVERLGGATRRLGMPMPGVAALERACVDALPNEASGVVRLTLTRGSGPRGYLPPERLEVRLLAAGGPLPPPDRRPLRVLSCETPPSENALLAGLKHTSRIDQVLAAAEVHARGADEGLLFTVDGQLVEGVSANVALRVDEEWLTPVLDRAGVAGVFRAWLLSRGLVRERVLTRDDVGRAGALCLFNAVRGVRPVGNIDGRELDPAPAAALTKEAGSPWSFVD